MTWVWAVKSAAESLSSWQDERDAFLVFFLAAINAEGHVACGMLLIAARLVMDWPFQLVGC